MNYKIVESNLRTLTGKLARLSAKLVKIGGSPVTFTVTGTVDEPHPDDAAKLIRYYNLEVNGETPKHNGWEFLATIVHTDEGNIIRSVPGYEVPANLRDKASLCEHCNTNRVRRDTYIVRYTDGTVKQVGSTCLQDFLKIIPGRLTKAAEILFNAYDIADAATKTTWLGGTNALSTYRIDLDTYLQNVAAVVTKDVRYITRKMARESEANLNATSDTALAVMTHRAELENGFVARYPITPEVEKLAADAREWVLSRYSPPVDEPEGMSDEAIMSMVIGSLKAVNKTLSDFEHNLLSCARAEAIEPRLCGIAAYIIEAFRRSQPRKEAVQLDTNGLATIFAMFATASTKGLKKPAIRLQNDAGQHLHLSLAGAASKNAGFVYVKNAAGFDSAYYGKISPEGKFLQVSSCPATVEPLLLAFAADPQGIATKYGKLTGCCSFCGRKLTDKRSTEMGYGPVCADKFGLNWGNKVAFAATVVEQPKLPIQHIDVPAFLARVEQLKAANA